MLAMHYRIGLAGSDAVAAVRRRVAERGPLFDGMAGLAHKFFLIDAAHPTYATFYLWRDEAAAQGFLQGPFFAHLVAHFGRPKVHLAISRSPSPTPGPAAVSRSPITRAARKRSTGRCSATRSVSRRSSRLSRFPTHSPCYAWPRRLEEARMAVQARLLVIALSALTWWTGTARAQDWPARSLTIVVAFPAGGSDDILARTLAPGLSQVLRQEVVVENSDGAGGMTGAARVASAAADGYTLLLGSSATQAISQALHSHPLYDSRTDFTPVGLVAEQPFVLILRSDLPAGNLPELAAYSKTSATKLRYGSAGTGSATHLVCALTSAKLGIAADHVPFNGGGQAMKDLIAGQIDYFCPVVTIAIPEIAHNSVKPAAMLTGERRAILPDMPSAAEQGFADLAASTWFGIFLPKNVPTSIVRRLHGAIMATVDTASVQERMTQIGASPVAGERRSPDYLGGFVASEIAKWRGAILAAGITTD